MERQGSELLIHLIFAGIYAVGAVGERGIEINEKYCCNTIEITYHPENAVTVAAIIALYDYWSE